MARSHGRILLVEDDAARAGLIVDLLLSQDYEVDGPYASVSDGVAALADHFPDGAVLDLHRSSGGTSLLKDDLEAYAIPFLECGEKGRKALENRLLPWLRQVRH